MMGKSYKLVKNPVTIKYKHKNKVRFFVYLFFDTLYCLVLSIVFPIFIYIVNNGIVRWYFFAFALLGFFVCKITLGKILTAILEYFNFYISICAQYSLIPLKKLYIKLKKAKTAKPKKEKAEKRNVILSYGK